MNIAKSIMYLFPNAVLGVDFSVQDDSDGNGPYIKSWNLPQPQPTQTELQAAWEIIKDRPPAKTPEQKEMDKLKAENASLNDQVVDLWETLLNAGVL